MLIETEPLNGLDASISTRAHSIECVTVTLTMRDRTIVLHSLRPWPGYLTENVTPPERPHDLTKWRPRMSADGKQECSYCNRRFDINLSGGLRAHGHIRTGCQGTYKPWRQHAQQIMLRKYLKATSPETPTDSQEPQTPLRGLRVVGSRLRTR